MTYVSGRSSAHVLEVLTHPPAMTADKDVMPEEFHNVVLELLQGERGDEPQRLLIDLGITLMRRDSLASLRSFLQNTINHLHFYAFRVLDQYGQAGEARTVLIDRLLGPNGLVTMADQEFQIIKINMAHIAPGQNQESTLYWRHRAKQFKYRLLEELSYYSEAARFIIETTGSTFSGSTSTVMNYTLSAKQTAEEHQAVFIKAHMGTEALSYNDLSIINLRLLEEFLQATVEGAEAETFEWRLQTTIALLPHLKPFEDVYGNLRGQASWQWRDVQQVTRTFARDIGQAHDACQTAIEKLFSTMYETDLLPSLEIEQLIEPLVKITEAALEEIRLHIEAWLQVLSRNRGLLQPAQ